MSDSQPDFTDSNLELLHSTNMHCMDTDEMVSFDKDLDPDWKFHQADSVWWRTVKPFFCQPADIYARIVPHTQRPNALAALGGYYHMVPDGCEANGKIVFNEIRNPAGFDLSAIRQTKRNIIRRGLRKMRLQRITSPELLLSEGYQIFLDWQKRILGIAPEKTDQSRYAQWVTRLTRHPHEIVLGAFYEDRLTAWIVARANGDRANLTKAFGHSDFRNLEPASTLIYAYILICAQNPQIKSACDGLRSTKPSLEEYKAALGFEHVEYPAYIHMRLAVRPLVQRLFPSQYKRLVGDY